MFTFALFLAIMSTAFEMYVVVKFKFLRNLFLKSTTAGLIFSFALSYGIGIAFSAGGLIAMTAAILSTILSAIIYSARLLEYATEPKKKQQVVNTKNTIVKTFKFWYNFFTAPVRAIMWFGNKVQVVKNRFTR